MKKILVTILLLPVVGISFGQDGVNNFRDLIVLTSGDSIWCNITGVEKDYRTQEPIGYRYIVPKGRKGKPDKETSIGIENVVFYSLYQPDAEFPKELPVIEIVSTGIPIHESLRPFRDLIVLTSGDSIRCNITGVGILDTEGKKDHYTYEYFKGRKTKTASVPAEKVSSYSLYHSDGQAQRKLPVYVTVTPPSNLPASGGEDLTRKYLDLIVATDGDSIRCSIFGITDDQISFYYPKDEDEYFAYIRTVDVSTYVLFFYDHGGQLPEFTYLPEQPPFLTETTGDLPTPIPTREPFLFRMYVEGGASLRILGSSEFDGDGSMGWMAGTNLQFISPSYRHAVGMTVDYMHQKYDTDRIITADMVFLAPTYSYIIPDSFYRTDMFVDVSAGYSSYREKFNGYVYNTGAFGTKLSIGMCMMGLRNVGVHFRISYFLCFPGGALHNSFLGKRSNSTINMALGVTFGKM